VDGVAITEVRQVLTAIADLPAVNDIRIVGVDGPSGSGKSTLARRLADRAGAPLIQVDDFVSWSDFDGWWPRFEHEALQPLVSGRDARYQVRDWEGDEFGTALAGFKTVRWAPVVVIEGVTCTRRATVGRLTYAVWVEAPAEVRLQRGLDRDGESHRDLWLQWMDAEGRFFAADRTRERANLRVNGAPEALLAQSGDQIVCLD
jgi:uridine kinase